MLCLSYAYATPLLHYLNDSATIYKLQKAHDKSPVSNSLIKLWQQMDVCQVLLQRRTNERIATFRFPFSIKQQLDICLVAAISVQVVITLVPLVVDTQDIHQRHKLPLAQLLIHLVCKQRPRTLASKYILTQHNNSLKVRCKDTNNFRHIRLFWGESDIFASLVIAFSLF